MNITGLNATTGAVLWTTRPAGYEWGCSHVVVDSAGVAFAAAYNFNPPYDDDPSGHLPSVFAVNTSDGSVLWVHHGAASDSVFSVVIAATGTLVLGGASFEAVSVPGPS